ncbi:MAG: DNA polymerase [Planctomycetota bacterium]
MHTVDWLFLDMNAYFASVEQHLRPELRGQPVAVVPVMTDRTCCIAASYEARPYGVRTGTNVGQARRQCPHLRLIHARHEEYIRVHKQIIDAVETVLPVEKVCSIDEMACRLSLHHRRVEDALAVGQRVKDAVAQQVGPALRCSVGVAPNAFLAKVATNLQKPDGLVAITPADLPRKLYKFQLRDLPGIGRGMHARLERCGVHTVRQLCALPRQQMIDVWNGVVGDYWWHWLRGKEYRQPETKRRSVSHSHVLAPAFRTDHGARSVMVRLIHKAAARLRRLECWARRIQFTLTYVGDTPRWRVTLYLGSSQDTQTMLRAFEQAWAERPRGATPLNAGMVLFDLTPSSCTPLPLFEEDRRNTRAARAIDDINEKLGPNSVYFASMHGAQEQAPMRIAFTHIPDVVAEKEC